MIHEVLQSYQGGYWRLCWHRSHRWRLWCFRLHIYDGQCSKHNGSCFNGCPPPGVAG